MRSHCAIYVDVGYLLAAAATRVTGTSLRRGVEVDHADLIRGLIERAEEDCGLPLLRVNWYDSGARPGGMPDFIQDSIGLLPRVKLRLGRLSHAGEQKGVDLRIGLDLATHGRNRVVDVIYLVSGDDDLTEAVEEAQGHGVQVILLAVPGQDGRPHGVARHLQRAADGLILLDGEVVDATVRSRAIPEALIPEELRPDGEQEDDDAAGPDAEAAVETEGAMAMDEAGPPAESPGPGPVEPLAADTGSEAGGPHPGEPDADGSRPTPPAPPPAGVNGSGPAHTSEAGSEPSAALAADSDAVPVPEPDHGLEREQQEDEAEAPSPSIFAKKKATTLMPPPEPVWTSTSAAGGYGMFAETEIDPEIIDTVARHVLRSWCTTATPEMLAELKEQRPSIPGDLDRAMLVDLSNRSGQYDIDEVSRYELRGRFWQLVDQVRLV
ncbi:MAG: NYN domain-containing protein [Dermatophilaceae bacterium]